MPGIAAPPTMFAALVAKALGVGADAFVIETSGDGCSCRAVGRDGAPGAFLACGTAAEAEGLMAAVRAVADDDAEAGPCVRRPDALPPGVREVGLSWTALPGGRRRMSAAVRRG